MSLTNITNHEINQLSYIAMGSITLSLRNMTDLQRIADTFCSGDLANAFELCFSNGMRFLLDTCDLDDYATEAGL